MAVVPPRSLRSSATVMPCRLASRLTTSRPIRRAVSAVTSPPDFSTLLRSDMASWSMPRPASLIRIVVAVMVVVVITSTGAVGGE